MRSKVSMHDIMRKNLAITRPKFFLLITFFIILFIIYPFVLILTLCFVILLDCERYFLRNNAFNNGNAQKAFHDLFVFIMVVGLGHFLRKKAETVKNHKKSLKYC